MLWGFGFHERRIIDCRRSGSDIDDDVFSYPRCIFTLRALLLRIGTRLNVGIANYRRISTQTVEAGTLPPRYALFSISAMICEALLQFCTLWCLRRHSE